MFHFHCRLERRRLPGDLNRDFLYGLSQSGASSIMPGLLGTGRSHGGLR